LRHPGAFALQTLKAFRANQGLLLAGAVADILGVARALTLLGLIVLAVAAASVRASRDAKRALA